MGTQRSVWMQLALLLLVCGVVFAGTLGNAWPYVAAAGAGLVGLRVIAAVLTLLRS